jgi:peptidoglycan-associated lipoprotein
MKRTLLVLLTAVVVCSTATLTAVPAIAGSESADLSGRWTGTWSGTGLLMSPREDSAILELVQVGDTAYGRMVIDGAAAAESVAYEIRTAGLSGIRIWAKIRRDKVLIRHEAGTHLFAADLKVSPDGQTLYGVVRGASPKVILVLRRASDGPTAAPPQTAKLESTPPAPPAEQLAKIEPAPKVMVMAPPAEPKDETPPAPPREENFVGVAELAPIHFDFDKADLRKDALDTLTAHLTWLKDHPDALLLIEGHCDERGTDEYNVALGERRAKSVSELLATHGISPDRISTTSLGRERPLCTAGTEECRMKNRRAEFRVKTH